MQIKARVLKEMKRRFGPSPQSMDLENRIDNRGIMEQSSGMTLSNILGEEYIPKPTRNWIGQLNHNLRNLHKQGHYKEIKSFSYPFGNPTKY